MTAESKGALDAIQRRLDGIEAEMKRPRGEGGGFNLPSEAKRDFFDWMRQRGLVDIESKTTLVGGTTAGEILVPEDLYAGVIRSIGKLTVMKGLVTVRPTNSDRVREADADRTRDAVGKLGERRGGTPLLLRLHAGRVFHPCGGLVRHFEDRRE